MKFFKPMLALFLAMQIFAGCGSNTNVSTDNIPVSVSSISDTTRRIEILSPEALKILDSSASLEVIAKGFKWTEGPVYIADGDYLLFSDIPHNKIYKWKEGEDTSTYLTPSGYTGDVPKEKEPGSNGLLLNKSGELVLMQQGDRRVAIMQAPLASPSPHFKVLADRYKGKRLNSPNDAVLAANGGIYFTDPAYGLDKGLQDTSKDLSFQGVYYLRPDGTLILLTDELKYPNGITLSPDGHFLYVDNSDPENKIWMKYELDDNGLIKNKSIFYRAVADEGKSNGNPDGMKMNTSGYLFTAGPGGIWIFNPAGEVIARIFTGQLTSNCALGKDQKELFITSSGYVLHVQLK
ncbi:MAG: SMP-30/gluconolactonase/LRE family protein [Ginsengibacter sp.]